MSEPVVIVASGDIVAIDKPAGWVAHAALRDERFDLRAWCAAQPGLPRSLEPLHRLDRDTSGVVLYAADPAVRAQVGRWFMDGAVSKRYTVLVQGRAHRKGVLRMPLAPDDGGAPQEAVTRYWMEEPLGGFSLLRVVPETGRKHQIRRHLQGIGLAVVGDVRYPPARRLRVPGFPGRLFLHAAALSLPDGRVFESRLPAELSRCLEALRAGAARSGAPGGDIVGA